jgi:hypothetical protein
VLLSSADARAGYIYDHQIDTASARLTQLNEATPLEQDEIDLQELVVGKLKKDRGRSEQFFRLILPLCLGLECLFAFYFVELLRRRQAHGKRKERGEMEAARRSAGDSRQEMAMMARNRLINRLADLERYSDGALQAMGLESGRGGGDAPDAGRPEPGGVGQPELGQPELGQPEPEHTEPGLAEPGRLEPGWAERGQPEPEFAHEPPNQPGGRDGRDGQGEEAQPLMRPPHNAPAGAGGSHTAGGFTAGDFILD